MTDAEDSPLSVHKRSPTSFGGSELCSHIIFTYQKLMQGVLENTKQPSREEEDYLIVRADSPITINIYKLVHAI